MKKLITLTVVILLSSCTSNKLIYKVTKSDFPERSIIHFKENTLQVDNKLLPYVKEYLNEAHNYNIPVDSLSKNYYGIFIEPTGDNKAGVTLVNSPYRLDFSVIDPSVLYNPAYLRVVIFHELHHKYKTTIHCHRMCGQIMSATASPLVMFNDWELQKKILFTNALHFGVY